MSAPQNHHAEQIKQALKLHQSGNLDDAMAIYKTVLSEDGNNVDALNLMGALALGLGQTDAAIALTARAVELAPDYFAPLVNLGNALQAANRLDEAVDYFKRALVINARDGATNNNLSSALNALSQFDEALDYANKAISAQPDMAEAYNNLGNALKGLGDHIEAILSFQKAISFDPDLGNAYYNLGTLFLENENWDQAGEYLNIAVAKDDKSPEKLYNLGLYYQKTNDYKSALNYYRKTVAINPDYTDAHVNLSACLRSLGRVQKSISACRRALKQQPDRADVHWNLALSLLHAGEYDEGWQEYEWRWKNPDFTTKKRDFPCPQWQGQDASGATLLIHAEQGFGDTIQFIRYATLAAQRSGRVIVECYPSLKDLFENIDGVDQVFATGDPLPGFDFHVPVMSLPLLFETTVDTVPNDVPYLSVPDDIKPHDKIQASDKFKVGFCWAGSPTNANDQNRSVKTELFENLFDVDGVDFFSLQFGVGEDGFDKLSKRDNVFNIGPDLIGFDVTAASMTALDLVISVDTVTVHLAGAVNVPIWVLQPFAMSYLWLAGEDSSPWYPSLKHFRQSSQGDWAGVMENVRKALFERVNSV